MTAAPVDPRIQAGRQLIQDLCNRLVGDGTDLVVGAGSESECGTHTIAGSNPRDSH